MRNFRCHSFVLAIFSNALSPLARAGEEAKTAATILTNDLKRLSLLSYEQCESEWCRFRPTFYRYHSRQETPV